MDFLLLGARLLLSAVLFVAGMAKLADRDGSRQAVADFGCPGVLVGPLAVLLPLAEIGVAASLIPLSSAWWGAVAATALFSLFLVGIGVNLALGRRPNCHCFGRLHSAPAGVETLARNAVLVAVAGLVVWQGREGTGLSAADWLNRLTVADLLKLIGAVAVAVVLLGQGWLLLNLTRQQGRLLLRLEVLEAQQAARGKSSPTAALGRAQARQPLDARAPDFRLSDVDGASVALDSLLAPGRPLLLVFLDPGCDPCTALLPRIAGWQREHARFLTIALVSRGEVSANRERRDRHGLSHFLLQANREVATAYRAFGTPAAVLVHPGGTLASPAAGGADAIAALVERALRMTDSGAARRGIRAQGDDAGRPPTMTQPARQGDRAPRLRLPDLQGDSVDLVELVGRPTCLLFWNPRCGFCVRILNEIRAWERDRPPGAAEVLVVSSGGAEETRQSGFRARVVLDQEFAAARAFGATGTPSAVLVDEQGTIASDLAVGAPAVLALIRAGQRQALPAASLGG